MSKIESSIRDGAIIYSSTFIYNAREYDISWRVKSVQSILQKQWESEEYTNADAMRDVAASSLIHPDGDENGDTVELMSKIC